MRNAVDPAKCGLKRTRIELTMLNFRPGAKRCQPPRALMGLIARGSGCTSGGLRSSIVQQAGIKHCPASSRGAS